MKNKAINTTATGDYSKGYSGAPSGYMAGSIEGKAKGHGYYDKTYYDPNYLKPYSPEELSGAYKMSNQNKS